MESNITPNQQYKQVTVEVPEERVAAFHAMFARFLARSGRGRRSGRYGHRHHGRGCADRAHRSETREPSAEATGPSTETTQL